MIDIFNNKYLLNNQKCNIATIWLMILIIFMLIFINIALNYNYKKYDKYLGYIKNIDGFKLILYVEEKEVSGLKKYNLIIDGSKYKFQILNISKEYYIIDSSKFYEVILDVNLNKDLLIENNIIDVIFEKEYTTLFEELKKGIKLWIN